MIDVNGILKTEFEDNALYFEGEGTEAAPYLIRKPEQLVLFASLINRAHPVYSASNVYYKLAENIDLSDCEVSDIGWRPIGSPEKPFKGIFNGNNNIISNLKIQGQKEWYTGLFGHIGRLRYDGIVKNLGVVNLSITGDCYAGGIAAYVTSGQIINCYTTGNINSSLYVGGIAGCVWKKGALLNCYSACTINSNSSNAGGVAGRIDGRMRDCYATGSVSGIDDIGGIAGCVWGDGMVSNCYSTGEVKGAGKNISGVAGIVGYATLANCVALNSVITGEGPVERVAALSLLGGNLIGNYALTGLKLEGKNSASDGQNGDEVEYQNVVSDHFWTETLEWSRDAWDFPVGRLPELRKKEK